MSTVIAVPRRIDRAELEDLDEDRAAAEIVRQMEARFPGEAFHPCFGGEADGIWNLLVRGNNWDTPTAEQTEVLAEITESVLCGTDEFYGLEA